MHQTVATTAGCAFVEDIIRNYLEYFAIEDAIFLAEIYHDTVKNNQSLYLLSHCLLRSGQLEGAYNILQLNDTNATPELRFLHANCCYEMQRLQEAELILRKRDQPKLDESFVGTKVEPFAHALLSRLFVETGRVEEAKDAIELGLQMNVLSWTNIKAYCNVGASDVEAMHSKLLQNVSKMRRHRQTEDPKSLPIKTKQTDKESKDGEKKSTGSKSTLTKSAPNIPKKSKAGVASKRNIEGNTSKRRTGDIGGMETRRTTRAFGASHDSENQSTIGTKESRTTARAKIAGISTGGAVRSLQDKQLRSMNRINEMEVSRVVHHAPSIHKLLEPVDTLADVPPKIEEEQVKPEHIIRTRSGSQSVIPLSSHDPNALSNKQQDPSNLITLAPLSSSSNTSLSSSASHQQIARSRHRAHRESQKHLGEFTVTVPSFDSLRKEDAKWPNVFVDVVECVCWLTLLQCSLSKFKTKAGIDRYNEMPQRFAKTAMARELLARLHFERLDFNKTREILEKLHREYSNRLGGMEILSTALWHSQDSKRLSTLAAELTEKARSSPETWCVAGNCFSVQKQHDTAVECIERAVSLNPRFVYAFSLLGHELLDTDQLEKAAAAFRRALMLCPSDYRAWFGLGLMHFKKEQVTLARVHLSKAVAINPSNSVLLCQLSVVEQTLRNNTTAMDLLQRALLISPENAACRFYRARLLYETHDYEKCRDELNELKLYAHDEAQVFFLLGRVYKKLGQTHMALLNFSWAAEMDPKGEQSRNNLCEAPYDDDTPPAEA